MERRGLFSANKKKGSKNFLLERPELVSPKEIAQKGELVFCFYSKARRYCLGYHENGDSFFVVECFDFLPDGLSEEEKEKFTKVTERQGGVEKEVYFFKYGRMPKSEKDVEGNVQSQDEEYHVAQPRNFEREITYNPVADEMTKQAISKILSKHLGLTPEESLQRIEQTLEDSFKQDGKAAHFLLDRFLLKFSEEIQAEIRNLIFAKPQEMTIEDLIQILRSKKVLFYTGAGISMANGVFDMNQLQKELGIEMSGEADDFLKKAVANPQEVINSWKKFLEVAFGMPATFAHQALGRLAEKLESQIFTENVDLLQERAGVKPVHLTGYWLRESVDPDWLKDIDAVVTVGLGRDDRGFLGWYKENNQNGKIIAINLNQPSYLGNEDFLLKGDCQKIIPELAKRICC